MKQVFSIRIRHSCFDNRKSVLSPSTPLRINSVERSKTGSEPRRSIQYLKWLGLVSVGVTFALWSCLRGAAACKKDSPRRFPFSQPANRSERPCRSVSRGTTKARIHRWTKHLCRLPLRGQRPRTVGQTCAELVHLNADVIVTSGSSATRPAKEATATIPIVMMSDSDPVASGFVISLARPGGNITGLTTLGGDLGDKRLELLKEIIPKLSRVAVFRDLTNVTEGIGVDEIEPTARVLKIQTQKFELARVEDFDSQFQAITKWRPGGLMLGGGPLMNGHRKRIVEFAAKSKVPAMYNRDEFVEAGGLVSYATSFIDLSRRAATYVDKIIKGAKPADLPVEQPKKFDLIINLKAAKQIDLTIPPNVLARADKVIR